MRLLLFALALADVRTLSGYVTPAACTGARSRRSCCVPAVMKMTDNDEPTVESMWQLRHELRLREIKEMRRAEKTPLAYDIARQTVQLQGLRSEREWRRWIRNNRKSLCYAFVGHYVPEQPDKEYDEFVSWDDWLGVPLKFEEARRVAATLGVNSQVSHHPAVLSCCRLA